MKSNHHPKRSVTEPLLRELADRQKTNRNPKIENPGVESKPVESPDLYQDSGGGYNPDFTFPQE